jgi:methionine--tRNA ligase beta chain
MDLLCFAILSGMTFADFKSIDLRVGKILAAERVADSEKLIRLRVDLGGEERQLVAGIGKVYEPESLVNKEIAVVANLEPKTLMGIESQGMLLAAHDANGEPVILTVEKEVQPGSKIT